jgi:hypothetical protein
MNHEKARLLLSQAEGFLIESHRKLVADEDVKLEGFEIIVRDLCEEISGMSKEDAKIYEKSLQALGDSLHALEEALKSKRDDMKNKIHELDAAARASSAYQNQGN